MPPPTTAPSGVAPRANGVLLLTRSGADRLAYTYLAAMVNVVLGNADISSCTAYDANHDGLVTVDEIVVAVKNALNGCLAS